MLIFLQNLGILLKEFNGLQQQIIEIHRVVSVKSLLIFLIDVRHLLLEHVIRDSSEFLRIYHLILGDANA